MMHQSLWLMRHANLNSNPFPFPCPLGGQVVRDCKLPEGTRVAFTGVLFQPRPWTPTETKVRVRHADAGGSFGACCLLLKGSTLLVLPDPAWPHWHGLAGL